MGFVGSGFQPTQLWASVVAWGTTPVSTAATVTSSRAAVEPAEARPDRELRVPTERAGDWNRFAVVAILEERVRAFYCRRHGDEVE